MNMRMLNMSRKIRILLTALFVITIITNSCTAENENIKVLKNGFRGILWGDKNFSIPAFVNRRIAHCLCLENAIELEKSNQDNDMVFKKNGFGLCENKIYNAELQMCKSVFDIIRPCILFCDLDDYVWKTTERSENKNIHDVSMFKELNSRIKIEDERRKNYYSCSIFSKRDENLNLFAIEINSIDYVFDNTNGFMKAIISYNKNDTSVLIKEFKARFGGPNVNLKTDKYICMWEFDDVSITFLWNNSIVIASCKNRKNWKEEGL